MELKYNPTTKKLVKEYQVDGQTKVETVSDYIYVSKVIKKLPENQDMDEIELTHTRADGSTNSFRVPYTLLAQLDELAKVLYCHKFLYAYKNRISMQEYLIYSALLAENKGHIKYEHTLLGCGKFNNKDVFFGETAKLDNNAISTCVRDFGKFTNGDEKIYDDMLEKYVYPSAPLSLAYVLGFTGVVCARLHEMTDVGTPIFGLTNRSSTGKTISSMLACSVFANPSPISGSLFIKTDATTNGFYAQIQSIYGLPIILDDITDDSKKNLSDLIYRLSNGKPRVVSNVKNEVIKRNPWKSVVILSSETSLLDNINKGGIWARYCEFRDTVFTASAEIARAIKKVVSSNYGFKGFRYGEWLSQKSDEEILEDFENAIEEFQDRLQNKDNLSERIASKYACILLTIDYVNTLFGNKIDKEKVLEFLVSNEEKNLMTRDAAGMAYNYLYESFCTHRNQFNIIDEFGNTIQSKANEILGNVIYKNDCIVLNITNKNLEKIMYQGKFYQYSSYKWEWLKRGYIKANRNRTDSYTKELGRHMTFIFQIKDIEFKQFDEDMNEIEQQENLITDSVNPDLKEVDEITEEVEKVEEVQSIDEGETNE